MYQGNDCMSQISGLLDCYGQVQAATAFIAQVLASKPIAMKGVTDGSDAQPGQIGEWVQWEKTGIPVVASVATTTLVPIGTLQPGDWDVTATLSDFAWSDGNLLWLDPKPAGFSTTMFGASLAGTTSGPLGQANNVYCLPARASLSVPTLVTFSVTTNYLAGAIQPGQAADLFFFARRMR